MEYRKERVEDRLRNTIFSSWISYRGTSEIILVPTQIYHERHSNIILNIIELQQNAFMKINQYGFSMRRL